MRIYLVNPAVATMIFLALATAGVEGAQEALQEKSAPTLDELATAIYQGIYDEPVRLDGGVYEGEPFTEGSASRPRVELIRDSRMTGDLDGDGSDEAAVLLSESSGGSGTRLYIAVVGRRDDTPVNLATALVGDRVQVRAERITDGRIELDVVQAGPDDAACCPSQKATRSWSLRGSKLTESKPDITGTLSLSDLEGTVWILSHLDWDEPVPEEPEITMVVEGERVTGMGGCNRYFAQVEALAPGELSMGPIGSTQRACPEPIMELETRFLEALGGVVRYSFLTGKLALTARAGNLHQTLLFVSEKEQSEPETSDRKSSIEDAQQRGVDFYAVGNEPDWTLEIDPNEIVFQTNYGQDSYRFSTPEPEIEPRKLRTVYRAESEDHDLVVEILELACADNTSSERFESTVLITFDGQKVTGCGLALH